MTKYCFLRACWCLANLFCLLRKLFLLLAHSCICPSNPWNPTSRKKRKSLDSFEPPKPARLIGSISSCLSSVSSQKCLMLFYPSEALTSSWPSPNWAWDAQSVCCRRLPSSPVSCSEVGLLSPLPCLAFPMLGALSQAPGKGAAQCLL